MKKKKILVLLGSTKSGSANQKIVAHFIEKTAQVFEAEVFDQLAGLPFFNPDLDTDGRLPGPVAAFRKKISEADGVLISTPEYVFSLPGVLKNALEWTVSTMVFDKKPVALITAASSGEAAHGSGQLILKTIGAEIGEKCALLIRSPKSKMDAAGKITDPATIAGIDRLIENFNQKMC